jgi:hypothetical protein
MADPKPLSDFIFHAGIIAHFLTEGNLIINCFLTLECSPQKSDKQ